MTRFLQLFGQFFCTTFGRCKDNDLFHIFVTNNFIKQTIFVIKIITVVYFFFDMRRFNFD